MVNSDLSIPTNRPDVWLMCANTMSANKNKRKVAGPGNKKGAQIAEKLKNVTKHGTAQDEEIKEYVEKMKDFKNFYRENNFVIESEWGAFLKACTTDLPLSFRFLESYHLCPSHVDTVPGVASQAAVAMQYLKREHVENLSKMTVDRHTVVKLEPIQWYPKSLGWSLNISKADIEKYLGLKKFNVFLGSTKASLHIQSLETWSMIPIILMDIKPEFVVLDMCAAPGFIASQICEQIHSDPLMANTGLLILNDLYRVKEGMHFHLTAGTKVIFSNLDARKYPDLYLNEQKTINNLLKYDRIVCDVKCSSDGTMRKNRLLQDTWNIALPLRLHSEQKAILKRALELVKVKGQVLYCTTSMNPIENEAVVMAILKECQGTVELIDCCPRLKNFVVQPGIGVWKIPNGEGIMMEKYTDTSEQFRADYPETVFPPTSVKEILAFHLERCIRVLPHNNNSAGMFCAVLVKNKELPWVTAKILQEMSERRKQAMVAEQPPKLKEYGYTLELKCMLSVDEIEWTTETTNKRLETTSRKQTFQYNSPPQELDPKCKPTALMPGARDRFAFCENDTEDWLPIKEFFQISDDFDVRSLRRSYEGEFYYSTALVKTLIKHNRDIINTNFGKDFGVIFFLEMPEVWIKVEQPKCRFIMSNEALAFLYPYIGKQVVNIDRDDLLKLAYHEKVKIENLSEKAQAAIKETDTGCILFVYIPNKLSDLPNCNITLTGVRNETHCIDYRYGHRTREQKRIFWLAGMERDDYSRLLQEKKMEEIVAKYKQEAAMESQQDTEMDIT